MRFKAYLVSKLSGKPIDECARWLNQPSVERLVQIIFDSKEKHARCQGRGNCWQCIHDSPPHCVCGFAWSKSGEQCEAAVEMDPASACS